MRLGLVVFGVLLCGACGSKPESSSSDDPDQSSKASKSNLTRAQKAARDLDAQLIDPPPDVVAALGAEVYPGARVLKSMKAVRGEGRVDYVFFTSDSPQKVRDFYEGKLAKAHRGDAVMEKMNAFVVKGTNTNGDQVTVQAQGHGEQTTFHFIVSKKQ